MAQVPAKIAKTGGDDLDDGLELDPELLASDNEDESDAEFENDADIGEEETRVAVDEESEDEADGGADVGEKRKREGDGEEDDAAAEKRKRKREKFKERKAKVSLALSRMRIWAIVDEVETREHAWIRPQTALIDPSNSPPTIPTSNPSPDFYPRNISKSHTDGNRRYAPP